MRHERHDDLQFHYIEHQLNELVVHVVESRADVGAVEQPFNTPPILSEQPADDDAIGVIGHCGDPDHADHGTAVLHAESVLRHLWHSWVREHRIDQ